MAAALYLANPSDLQRSGSAVPPVLMEPDGYYWFLYRYFESANLERHKRELIDLYGGGVIEGYQLHRLRCELEQAYEDVQHKPQSWSVLIGWTAEKLSPESESRLTVDKDEMMKVISSLLALVWGASESLKLVCGGD